MLLRTLVQTIYDGEPIDAMHVTFNRGNVRVTGPSWKVYQEKFPSGTFAAFWELCCSHYSLHSYPLRFSFGHTGVTRLSRRCLDTAGIELAELAVEEDPRHCFVYDKPRAQGGLFEEGSVIELPFS